MTRVIITILLALSICSCTPARKVIATQSVTSIRFLDEYTIPQGIRMDSTTLGGLSGIDYDIKNDIYFFICDDPSALGPARFYTATIAINANKIDTVNFLSVTPLINPAGQPYPDIRKDRSHSADVEAMRLDPWRKQLVRSTEGQRVKNTRDYQQPEIVVMNRNGKYKSAFTLPPNVRIDSAEYGLRHNGVFEGLTFSDSRTLLVSIEDVLYQDGPRAATGDSSAWTRIMAFDLKSRKPVAQYAYNIDPVQKLPAPSGGFIINGVTDILAAGNGKYLVLERSWSTGQFPSQIRVYLADFTNASDVSAIPSLLSKNFQPITKKLLFNMEDIGRPIFNIEGMSFGPVLDNGHQSLLFISDDNFRAGEKNQLLLFEIIP